MPFHGLEESDGCGGTGNVYRRGSLPLFTRIYPSHSLLNNFHRGFRSMEQAVSSGHRTGNLHDSFKEESLQVSCGLVECLDPNGVKISVLQESIAPSIHVSTIWNGTNHVCMRRGNELHTVVFLKYCWRCKDLTLSIEEHHTKIKIIRNTW